MTLYGPHYPPHPLSTREKFDKCTQLTAVSSSLHERGITHHKDARVWRFRRGSIDSLQRPTLQISYHSICMLSLWSRRELPPMKRSLKGDRDDRGDQSPMPSLSPYSRLPSPRLKRSSLEGLYYEFSSSLGAEDGNQSTFQSFSNLIPPQVRARSCLWSVSP